MRFELFSCCRGRGISFSNKAVEKGGDYKKIAYVSERGHIMYYVDQKEIPSDAAETIRNRAERIRSEFIKRWNQKDINGRLRELLDSMNDVQYQEEVLSGRTAQETIAKWFPVYLESSW